MYFYRLAAFLACAVALMGCQQESSGSLSVDSTASELRSMNDLSFNRLVFNRLVFNRLVFNRLVFNRLSENRLVFNSLDDLEASPEGRDLLTYVARCALAEGDVLVATHEGQTYEFPGLLGLATEWEHRALTASEGRWVSSCLLTHVNAFGQSVQLSVRAPGRVGADVEEAADFPVYEATFFGDVFGDELSAYACLGSVPEIALAHAPSRALRVCADPSPECEIEAVGYCRDVCEQHVDGVGWTGCWAGEVRYEETMSSYLRSEGEICTASCGHGWLCELLCETGASWRRQARDDFAGHRILDCDGTTGVCLARCKGAACSVDGNHAAVVVTKAKNGAHAEFDCADTGVCISECKGQGTSCELDCTGAGFCRIDGCKSGAECLLDCSDADRCELDGCWGELRTCADGVMVCNRACP